MRRMLFRAVLCMACVLFLCVSSAEGHLSPEPSMPEGTMVRTYESPSLDFTVERFSYAGTRIYATRIWMQDPARQIEKGTSNWRKNLMFPSDQAKKLPKKAMVAINGSGFISKAYPQIPDDYPGRSADYFNTTYGALAVTDGEVLRNLEGVRFFGVTLEADGLQLYAGASTEEVLANHPIHTWSFYDASVLVLENENRTDRDWLFSNEKEARTALCRMEDGTLLILTVTKKTSKGMTLVELADFIIDAFHPLWAFNLDGGPSSTLLVRPNPTGTLKTVYGNTVKTADIMGFCELSEGD